VTHAVPEHERGEDEGVDAGSGAPGEASAEDVGRVVALQRALLDGEATVTLQALAAASDMSPEVASLVWHALGFADSEPPGRLFAPADLDALERLNRIVKAAGADEEFAVGLIRALGHHTSRLVTWQVVALVEHMTLAAERAQEGADAAVAFMAEHLEDMDALVSYAWRRHMAAMIKWRLGRGGEDSLRMLVSVGFADMVAYTRLTQQMEALELAGLVARFESVSANVVQRQGGRVVKTVGDEILFVADTAQEAVDIALDLADAMAADPLLPDVRVGVATGEVVSRFGDVYGPTVNLASRLTASAGPGTVLVDAATAAALPADLLMEVTPHGEAELPGVGTVSTSRVRRL
jgi:adenylate cyclase